MTKRAIKKQLSSLYKVEKASNNSYDFNIVVKGIVYAVKFISVKANTQMTINSPYIWELQTGKLSGIRFIKRSSQRIDLRPYNKQENKIVFLMGNPFRMLKYLNEADIVDITGAKEVHSYKLFNSIIDFETI